MDHHLLRSPSAVRPALAWLAGGAVGCLVASIVDQPWLWWIGVAVVALAAWGLLAAIGLPDRFNRWTVPVTTLVVPIVVAAGLVATGRIPSSMPGWTTVHHEGVVAAAGGTVLTTAAARDARTGEVRWEASGKVVAAVGDVAIVASGDTLSGVDISTGVPIWERTIAGAAEIEVTATGDGAFVLGHMVVDVADGEVRWAVDDGLLLASLSPLGDHLPRASAYVVHVRDPGATSRSQPAVVRTIRSGEVVMELRIGDSFAVVGDRLVVKDPRRWEWSGIELPSGREVWRWDEIPFVRSMDLVDDVIISDVTGRLRSYDVRSGDVLDLAVPAGWELADLDGNAPAWAVLTHGDEIAIWRPGLADPIEVGRSTEPAEDLDVDADGDLAVVTVPTEDMVGTDYRRVVTWDGQQRDVFRWYDAGNLPGVRIDDGVVGLRGSRGTRYVPLG